MNRQEEAKRQMAAERGRWWKPVEVSVGMDCAPSIARAAMDGLVQAGHAVKGESDTYMLLDVRKHILTHLKKNAGTDFTAIGLVEALPELALTEQRAMKLLHDLEENDWLIAFYQCPAEAVGQ